MRALGLLALLIALACARPGDREAGAVARAAFGEPFGLGVGEHAVVGGEFGISFVRVSEDSRCPTGARCIQAGNAAAVFAVALDGGSATLTLNTDREPRAAATMGRTVILAALEPRPSADMVPDSASYRASVVVR